jgi:hypothetical protein
VTTAFAEASTGRPGAIAIAWDLPASWLIPSETRGTHVLDAVDGAGRAVIVEEPTDDVMAGSLASTSMARPAIYRLRQADGPAGAFLGSTPYILSVRTFAPEAWRDEMRAWLTDEHSDRLRRIGGAEWYLGYEAAAEPFAFLNLWGLPTAETVDQPAWREAMATAWTQRLQPAMARRERAVYRVQRHPYGKGE